MKTLPLEVVGLMVILVLFMMGPPGPVQLILTVLTPVTVSTLHSIVRGFPTIPCMGLDGSNKTTGVGATCIRIIVLY